MSDVQKALSGEWHRFGRDGAWIASSAGWRSNTTIAQVFGHSAEDISVRANAMCAAPKMLEALEVALVSLERAELHGIVLNRTYTTTPLTAVIRAAIAEAKGQL